MTIIEFHGATFFRQRLILSILSGKAVKISDIRPEADTIGLTSYEISFLKLLEKITNGSTAEINYTGTSILYKPGSITGGEIHHECDNGRGIGYYLFPLFALAPFSKKGFSVTFDGITNSNDDVTIDTLRTVTIKNMLKLGVNEIELKINKRGAPPLGGGSVFFSCGIVKSMKPINLMEEGRVKKIRGVAYSTKITPQMSNRLVESAKSILNEFIPDVYIYTDHFKGKESGNSPGFGLSLVAETTNGTFYSTEGVANPGELPEDIGVLVSKQLYSEIDAGGCVDTLHQWLFVLFMVLGPEDVSKVRFGRELTQQTIQYLRDLKEFFGVTFKIRSDIKSNTCVLTCLGIGYININKKTT